ncbi:MAG: MFS transporter [Rhodothermales bacterium]
MNLSLYVRLSLMMFLQFFVWGAWYVTVGIYMTEVGWGEWSYLPYTLNPIAAIVSPFFLGMIADRFFSTEKVLGVLHILGGIAMLCAPLFAEGPSASLWLFNGLILIHVLCYMPTLGLTNSLAFHNIENQEKQFPVIRVLGTIGWIVAGVIIGYGLHAEATALPLYIAGGAGILLGLYSFALPHTPPPAAGQQPTFSSILGVDALKKLASKPFVIFIVSSFLISIPLAAYYTYAPRFVASAGIADPAFKMTFGQMSEVLFMLLMPLFFARLGVKWMLSVGMLAWVLRYVLFAVAAPSGIFWMIMVGIILHGICYDFFFVSGQIYVDKKSTADIRGQAQGFLVLMTYGLGMFIGAWVSGVVFNAIVTDPSELGQWQTFWYIPAAFAGVILLFFVMTFKDRVLPNSEGESEPVVSSSEVA